MHDFLGVNLLELSKEISFECFLPYGPMLTKKIVKQKKKKNVVEIWWTGSFAPNLALLRLTVLRKRVLLTTDDRQVDDGRPRDDSDFAVAQSRAKSV